MTTKEYHVLKFWYEQLEKCVAECNAPVSAGTLAKAVGQSRATALKYMSKLVHGRSVIAHKVIHVNGMNATLYTPIEGNN